MAHSTPMPFPRTDSLGSNAVHSRRFALLQTMFIWFGSISLRAVRLHCLDLRDWTFSSFGSLASYDVRPRQARSIWMMFCISDSIPFKCCSRLVSRSSLLPFTKCASFTRYDVPFSAYSLLHDEVHPGWLAHHLPAVHSTCARSRIMPFPISVTRSYHMQFTAYGSFVSHAVQVVWTRSFYMPFDLYDSLIGRRSSSPMVRSASLRFYRYSSIWPHEISFYVSRSFILKFTVHCLAIAY